MRLKGRWELLSVAIILSLLGIMPAFSQETDAPSKIIKNCPEMKVVLIVDKSTSIRKGPCEKGKQVAAALMDKFTPETEVALVAVGNKVEDLTGFIKNREILLEKLAGLQPVDKHTLLNQAVYQAAEELGRTATGQKAILLFSDGVDDGSYLTINDCIDKVKQEQVKVLAFNLLKKAGNGANFMKRLARVSDGLYDDTLALDHALIMETLQRPGRGIPPPPISGSPKPALSKPQPAPAPTQPKTVMVVPPQAQPETSRGVSPPVVQPDAADWKNYIIGLLSTSVLLLLGLFGVTYLRRPRPLVQAETQIDDLELRTLRAQAKQLHEDTKRLDAEMLRYGNLREEQIRLWRDVSFDTAKKAVEVLKTCWLEREDPLGTQIYGELLSNLKAIGVEEINPQVGEEIDAEDRRYQIYEKTGNPPYKVTKVIYPGYYFRPRVQEEPGEKNLLEPAHVELMGV